MKLILAKGPFKREIETPFALCCDMEELERLIRELQAQRAGMIAHGATYGWIRVDTSHPSDGPCNSPPLRWDA